MILPSVQIETAPQPRHAVIWMHGLGANGHDFEPIVPELVGADWPPLRFVFPHAPTRAVTVNNGMRMPAWYDIKGFEIAQRQDEVGIRESITQIEVLIAREVERGVVVGNILIAGFSQGAAMALSVALRHAEALAGVIALSGYLPLRETLAAEASPMNAKLPVFIGHGSVDPVVPEFLGQESRDFLRELGYPVDWHSYRMAHQVCAEEISDLRDWIGARFRSGMSAS